jgi:hypothetical protein
MNTARIHPARLGATAAAVSLALVGAMFLGPVQSGQAAGGQEQHAPTSARAVSGPELKLHDQMRRLWEEHVAWTRLAIVTFAGGTAGFNTTATRLLRNQKQIGAAFARYYGTRTGNHVAALLHDHITIAVEILQAAKAGDQAGVQDASKRWYANANEIADFLSSLNRHAWPRKALRSMMKTHLDQTLAEAVDELTGHYYAGVREYSQIEQHILEMADTFTAGIAHQFPGRFSR